MHKTGTPMVIRKIILSFMALAILAAPCDAIARTKHKANKRHHARGGLVDGTAAYADIVIDAQSGQVLHATNPDAIRHPASLSKMMTLYITFQALEAGRLGLNQYIPISTNAAEQPPSKLGLRPGQRIKVEDAIMGLVTESANDAAMVLAEWQGGSAEGFGHMMTRQAQALGMAHSHFDNPSGLPDPDQVTTAHDMAVLGDALIYHFPQFYPYFDLDGFTYAGSYRHNHNHLKERYDGMDGIKTGYIRASGFNLVASAKRGNTRLIGVVFGGHSAVARDNRMAQLLDQAFAVVEKGGVQASDADNGEGDSDDNADNNATAVGSTITLPAKGGTLPSTAAARPAANTVAVVAPPTPPRQSNGSQDNPMAGSAWAVQIGTFSDPKSARTALDGIVKTLPDILGSADPQVMKITAGPSILYRARLNALDARTAQQVCNWMIQHGRSCLTVGPS